MFALYQFLSQLIMPLPVSLFLVGLGLILLLRGREVQKGFAYLTSALLLLLAFSTPLVSNVLLIPLERQYSSVQQIKHDWRNIEYALILGDGNGMELDNATLGRLNEAHRLKQLKPDLKLITSGVSLNQRRGSSDFVSVAAEGMDIAPLQNARLGRQRNTVDQARAMQEFIGNEPFFLVTCASQMPRSMRLFESLGLQPVPAPADYTASLNGNSSWWPSSANLRKSEQAIQEYTGMLWNWAVN